MTPWVWTRSTGGARRVSRYMSYMSLTNPHASKQADEFRRDITLLPLCRDSWVQWAGAPKHLYLDPAEKLRSNELEGILQGLGTTLFVTAATWQRGRIERHGHVLKEMLSRMDAQKPIATISEFDDCLAQCFSAKNALVRVKGYSPEQLVLGKSVSIPASLTSCDSAASHELAAADNLDGENFRQNLARRASARQAFHESAVRRALLRRSIPVRGPFLPGMWVLYWIKRTNPNRLQAGKWHGPARVIAADGQSVVWLSHGTKTIRAPPEYLRPASLHEWNQVPSAATSAPPATSASGASAVINLEGLPPPPRTEVVAPNDRTEVPETLIIPTTNAPVPELPQTNRPDEVSVDGDVHQPEHELTLQATPGDSPPGPSIIAPAEAPDVDPNQVALPDYGELDERLAETTGREESILLSQVSLTPDGDDASLLETFELHAGVPDSTSQILLAEDNLPWLENPLCPAEHQAFSVEIPLKVKDFQKWLREPKPEQLASIAAAGKRARVEVKLKELTAREKELFKEAKAKELNCWVQTTAVRKILRSYLNPGQILKSRWVLTWKAPENPSDPRKAKARLVVLGYQDPKLTEVVRDSPTLSREGRAVVLQAIASYRWELQSFDIKTAFLRGKADEDNKLAMEPPEELRQLMGLKTDEVCELVGNAYGRVDAPLLFYQELKQRLLDLGFRAHPLDPCIFMLESVANDRRTLHGIMGIHVDDGVCGGDAKFQARVNQLQKHLPFGSQKSKKFVFTGMQLEQQEDYSIHANQAEYVRSIPAINVGRPRRQAPESPLSESEVSELRGIVGSLQYAVTHTRPDIAARLSEVQRQMAQPTVQALLDANRVLRDAQKHRLVTIKYQSISPENLTFVSFGDASFATSRNLSSHQGVFLAATTTELRQNVESPISPITWICKKISRVVRSTLSAEAYALSKSVDMLGWVRVLWGCIHRRNFPWKNPEAAYSKLHAAILVTDCKSLYDLVTRTAIPSCQEYRTTLEVLLICQRCSEHCIFRWIPTTLMVADCLTKSMNADLLREILKLGRFKLHDPSCDLERNAHRKEALQWLRSTCRSHRRCLIEQSIASVKCELRHEKLPM